MALTPSDKQVELCTTCTNAFVRCEHCVTVGVSKMSEYVPCKVLDISVRQVKKFRVRITGKYQWAVESGRFEGTEVEFATHLAVIGAPEVECYDDGSEGREVRVNG